MKIGAVKLDGKIGLGLFLVGGIIWIGTRQPLALTAFIPLLLGLACPIGMGLLMFLAMRGMGTMSVAPPMPPPPDVAATGRTRAEQLADLQRQLHETEAQQVTLHQELMPLEATSTPKIS